MVYFGKGKCLNKYLLVQVGKKKGGINFSLVPLRFEIKLKFPPSLLLGGICDVSMLDGRRPRIGIGTFNH